MSGHVLFFGKLRDVAGAAGISVPVAGQSLSQLRRQVAEGNPALLEALSHASVRVAVNHEIVEVGTDPIIPPGAEIAFMPPMSGG